MHAACSAECLLAAAAAAAGYASTFTQWFMHAPVHMNLCRAAFVLPNSGASTSA
jgi:hypothetical protein